MRAEIYPSQDGWRFRVLGNNGEVMCVGEPYIRRADAESALRQLFGFRQPLEVTVRSHGTNVVDHYVLGKFGKVPRLAGYSDDLTLDEVYPGPFEPEEDES